MLIDDVSKFNAKISSSLGVEKELQIVAPKPRAENGFEVREEHAILKPICFSFFLTQKPTLFFKVLSFLSRQRMLLHIASLKKRAGQIFEKSAICSK